jgi:enediyne biosynthesis protein E4
MHRFTRRELIKRMSMASGACGLTLGNFALGSVARTVAAQSHAGPLFEEVPASTSGINWRHVNARSAEYYLPETTGAGCAFLDYDNDGWMDIYLVNSGKCDFYWPNPPLCNAPLAT